MASNIVSTAKPMLGGADATNGVGGVAQFTVSGAWAANDTFNIVLTTPSDGRSATLGAGALTNQNPTFALTYKKKLYLLGGGQIMWFSAINQPTVVNDLNAAGNGFMDLSNEYGFSDNLLAAGIFQGKLGAFARRSIQIVAVDADPANNQVFQTLENIGTVNGDSVRNMGDMDIVFAADSGFRSLRVLDASGKLTPFDLGTPIDSLVQARMLSVGTSQMASIVEPFTNRLWEAIGNLIYVFSYFPQSGVAAWSTYTPSRTSDPIAASAANYPATPDGSGNYVLTITGLTAGKCYTFAQGNSELQLNNGTQTFPCVDGNSVTFMAQGTSVTIWGNASGIPYTGSLTTQTTFTPEKFEERTGRVYVRSTDGKIYLYGGTDNDSYDDSQCTWETPWLDARSAATSKLGAGMDAGLEGGWAVSFGADPVSGILKEVYRSHLSTFGKGVIPATMKGTHFKARGVTYEATYARFSAFAFHFEGGDGR